MAVITLEDVQRYKQEQGNPPPKEKSMGNTMTLEAVQRLTPTTTVDRDVKPDQPVRHKNMFFFLGDKLTTQTYRQEREKWATPGIYAKPERGVIDKIGDYMRNVGYLWYKETDTYKREAEARQKEGEPKEDIDFPQTILGNMGFKVKEAKMSPVSNQMAKALGVEDKTEQQGLNRLLSHNDSEIIKSISDMVADELPIDLAALDKDIKSVPTLFGDREYDGITIHNILAENLLATAVGDLMAGERGTQVAAEGHGIIANIIQNASGLDREESLALADKLVSSTADMLAENAADIGGFSQDDMRDAQQMSDPRGISMIPPDTTKPQEVYQSGITYWGARTAAVVERSILAKAGAPVALAELKRDLLERTDSPVIHASLNTVAESVVHNPLTHADAELLQTLKELFDPNTSPLVNFTPGVNETRAWRAMDAREKGKAAMVFNSIAESAFDFAAFLVEIMATRRIISLTPLKGLVQGVMPITAQATERLARTAPGGLTHLTVNNAMKAAQVSAQLRNAAFIGINRAMSTPGSFEERATAGLLSTLYASTPATTGLILGNLGYTGTGVALPIMLDFMSNSLITAAISYVPEYQRQGGFTDDFWTAAIPQAVFDLGMSLSTRAFSTAETTLKSQQAYDNKVFQEIQSRNGGEAVMVGSEKAETSDKYHTLKVRQRAKHAEVRETLNSWREMIKEKTRGDRVIEGTPDVEIIESRTYRDPEVSRFRKLGFKAKEKQAKLYARLSDVIDKTNDLQQRIDKTQADESAFPETLQDLNKEMSTLKSQRTRLEKAINIMEGKGKPTDTERPDAEAKGEPESARDQRIKSRISTLYSEIKALTKEEQKANTAYEKALSAGKGTAEAKRVLSAAQTKLRTAMRERDALIYYDRDPSVVTDVEYVSLETHFIKQQIQKFNEGFRKGQQITKKDIKAFQDYVIGTIDKATYLTPKQKENMLKSVSAIQTEANFEKSLAKLEMRIDELSDTNEAKLYEKAIDRLLKKAKKHIKKGVLDPETASIFNMASRMRLSAESGPDAFGKDMKELIAYDMGLLSKPYVSKEEFGIVYDDLVRLYNYGAATKAGMKASEEARLDRLKQLVVDDLTGTKDYKAEVPLPDEAGAKFKPTPWSLWWHRLPFGIRHIFGTLTDLSRNSAAVKGESVIEKVFDFFAPERDRESLTKYYNDWKTDIFYKAYGAQDKYDIYNKVQANLQDKVKVPLAGKKTGDINREVAIQRWMEWDQPQGRKRLAEKNGYTEDTMRVIEDFLTPADFKVIQGYRQIYNDIYSIVNPIFRELNGYDLPYRENYSPFVPFQEGADFSDVNMIDMMLHDVRKNPIIDSKSPLQELKGVTSLVGRGAVFLLDGYIKDMAHYVGFAKTIKDTNSVFKDPSVRSVVTDKFGSNILKTLDHHIDTLTRGKLEAAMHGAANGLHNITSTYTKAVLFASPKRAAIQTLSAMLYTTEMPLKDFVMGMLDTPRAIMSYDMEVLSKSDYMLSRGVKLDRDLLLVQDAIEKSVEGKNLRRFVDSPRFNDVMSVFIKMGDRAGIYAGAWPLYKYYTEKLKMDKTAALDKTLRFVNNTQQSTDISQMPAVLTSGNPYLRMFTLFKHTPVQYVNNYMDALVSSARISKTELAKTIAAYHTMAASYATIVNAGKIPIGAFAASALLGPFGDGLVFVGDGLKYMVGWALSVALDDPSGLPRPSQIPFVGKWFMDISDVGRNIVEISEAGVEADTVIALVRKLSEASGPALGAYSGAVRWGADTAAGINEFHESGDFWRMLLKMMSYSDYQMREIE